ncbi:LytR/AlgR family response regulator transcription factor [Marinilabilia rubra]|uniref:DNA-binding response regulator n=1 Tax=Marinilabilia rubra TaxID=2162893 RepID=A0A2U2B4T9_9BACT|nr:LytTR family DNA-binding domain-containing protein [Marinilabilia rubra]PWD98088.1 DNA-binding response regulator [Marinilabilia rubra]
MNILIVEDELPTRRLLKDMVLRTRPQWEIAGTSGSVEETVEWIQENPMPDLIFMDIQLSDGSSFEIFDKVDINSLVIFTTAYDEYAIQAFKVNSIDYLLKPINQKKLEAAIEKFERLYQKAAPIAGPDYNALKEMLSSGNQNYRSRLITNVANGFKKIDIQDIAWLVSSNKITSAVTFDGHQHVIDFTLDKLEKELDPKIFFRANRQFILNIEAIRKVENWFNGKLVVKTHPDVKEKIVVSRERAKNFKDWINQ